MYFSLKKRGGSELLRHSTVLTLGPPYLISLLPLVLDGIVYFIDREMEEGHRRETQTIQVAVQYRRE